MGKALSHVPDDHTAGCLPSTGSMCAEHVTRRSEAIPGEDDGKIIGRVKERRDKSQKGTPTPRSRPTRSGAALRRE